MLKNKKLENINVFNSPTYYRQKILEQSDLIKYNKEDYLGKSLICVFFTSYCGVGCPFCFFNSPSPISKNNIQHKFDTEGLEKFITFANNANVGYLQISGGGEPFLEKEAILQSIERVNADRIILVTSGIWAYNKIKAEEYLQDIEVAIKKRKTKTRVSIRLSISKDHSIKLKHYPLINLVSLFESKYKDNQYFTLQLKFFDNDDTLDAYLKQFFKNYKFENYGKNKSDDDVIIKIMPQKFRIVFESGYYVIVGKSRVFEPSLRPNLHNNKSIETTIDTFNKDLKQSQNNFPSIVFDANGKCGLDWIIEYNGNVCTWQNRVQDNLLNIYEDNYEKVLNHTIHDIITLSFIEKGAKYRDKIISEISKKTVILMKAVSIRDYAGTILFEDEKIRLYYNLRALQDYIAENRINLLALTKLPAEIQDILTLNKKEIKGIYKKADYSVFDQELKKVHDVVMFRDFLELAKLGHYELSKTHVEKLIKHYNKINSKHKINSLDDVEHESGQTVERRLTQRVMTMKKLEKEKIKNSLKDKTIYIFRHGETNWNVAKRIKGQLEDIETEFTPNGLKQIDDFAKFLKEKEIDIIYASDLERTKDTTIFANKGLNKPISFHKELRGFNMGIYQGFLFKDFIKEQSVIDAFKDHSKQIPGGESINQLNNRLMSFLENIIKVSPYQNIAIVTHSAAMSNLKAFISGESYVDIDSCILSYSNNVFKVIEANIIKK